MKYKMAVACNKFEQVFADQLKRTSELVSILSDNCSTRFALEIDVQRNKALLGMIYPYVGGKILFEGPDISLFNDDAQIEAVRNMMGVISAFLSKFNRSLLDVRKSCLTSYTQKEWDIIYEASTDNAIYVNECTINEDEGDYVIYADDKTIITNTVCYLFAIRCGLSENIANAAFGTKDASIEYVKANSAKENESGIESAIRNLQSKVTNEETVKGTYNDDRVMIPNPDNISNVHVRQFDKSKDFTVLDTIKALLKFDLDLPVNVICYAPAIGCYDMHINKISASSLYGYDKNNAVGFYIDEN